MAAPRKDSRPTGSFRNKPARKHSKWETIAIATASFVGLIFCGGSLYSNGIFLLPFMQSFEQSTAVATWACSLNMGLACIAGPLASLLINRFGLVLPTIIGAALNATALYAAAFSTNIVTLLSTFGVLAGVAFSVPMTSCIIAVNINTGKHRAIVSAIAFTGTSVGAFLYPLAVRMLLDHYGWRGALMVLSGFTLQVCIVGFVFKAARVFNPSDVVKQYKFRQDHLEKAVKVPTLCTVRFFLMITQSFVFGFSISVISNHFVAFLYSQGLSEHEGAFLLSASGLAGLISRPSQGVIAQHPKVNSCVAYSIFCVVGGLSGLLMTFTCDKWLLLALAVVYGICYNAIGPLNCEAVIAVTDIVRLPTAYGYNCITMGVGFMLGAPAAGLLYDVTNVYSNSIYFGSGIMVLSGLMMVPIYFLIKKRRSEELADVSTKA